MPIECKKIFDLFKIFELKNKENKKKPKDTIKNLKHNAVKGSLLSTIGFVVINAEDHRRTNIKGNILSIIFNKQINLIKSNKSTPKMN